ncbi:NlpC/P60 family protein [Ligilactobacillus equi]|nr:NlpC/P60 family protein [Ligilactobacillus equi]
MRKEEKKRYKMYKAGKHWVVTPLVFLGLAAGTHMGMDKAAADAATDTGAKTTTDATTTAQGTSDAATIIVEEDTAAENSEVAQKAETVNTTSQDTAANEVAENATSTASTQVSEVTATEAVSAQTVENAQSSTEASVAQTPTVTVTPANVAAQKSTTTATSQVETTAKVAATASQEVNKVDTTSTYNSSNHANKGHFDKIMLDDQGQLQVSGWHAADHSHNQTSTWMIVYDATTNREVTRQQYATVERDDVKKAYPTIYNAKYSGFNMSFDLSGYNLANHTIRLIARYSNNPRNGEGQYTDLWSQDVIPYKNAAHVDDFSINKNTLHVNGWHATDYSTTNQDQYVILFDNTRGHELARVKVGESTDVATSKRVSRKDVQKVYSNIANAADSGYDITFDLSKLDYVGGNQISVVSRYVNKNTNSTKTDMWSAKHVFNQSAFNLDNYSFDKNGLNVVGWHVSDYSKQMPNQYVILFDKSAGKEIARVKVGESKTGITSRVEKREDARNAYRGIYSNDAVGFNVTFANSVIAKALGHELQVVIRYSSDAKSGEGQRQDFWSGVKNLSTSAYNLDSFQLQDSKLTVNGWFFNPQEVKQQNKFLILFDQTAGHEVKRIQIGKSDDKAQAKAVNRPDVQKAYANAYVPLASGFSASFDMVKLGFNLGHNYQVVMRVSDDAVGGEGNRTDLWSGAHKFNESGFAVDKLTVSGNKVTATGWFASDQGYDKPVRYLILFDQTANEEVGRVKVSNNLVRNDVQGVYPNLRNAAMSGFSVEFTNSLKSNHAYRLIARFTNDAVYGEGQKSDQWGTKLYNNAGQGYSGNVNMDGATFYYRNGDRFNGLDGNVYYVNGLRYNGIANIGGQNYFYSNGNKQTGFQSANGNTYCFAGSNGAMQHGWQTINNNKYFFDRGNGVMYTGTHNIDGANYTFQSNGVLKVDTTRERVASVAKSLIGTPYAWGGTTTAGFDCSGFTQYVYARVGINLGRTTYQQQYNGTRVAATEARPGDLLFWGSANAPHHVGISLGNGKYIDASTYGQPVAIRSTAYYAPSFGVRVVNS